MQKEIWVQIGSRNFNLPIQHLYTKTNHFWGEKICQYRRCIQWCIHLTATGEPDKNVHTPPMMTPPSAKTKQNQRQFCVYLPFSWNLYHFSLFIHYNLVSLFFNYSIEFKYIIVLYFFFLVSLKWLNSDLNCMFYMSKQYFLVPNSDKYDSRINFSSRIFCLNYRSHSPFTSKICSS